MSCSRWRRWAAFALMLSETSHSIITLFNSDSLLFSLTLSRTNALLETGSFSTLTQTTHGHATGPNIRPGAVSRGPLSLGHPAQNKLLSVRRVAALPVVPVKEWCSARGISGRAEPIKMPVKPSITFAPLASFCVLLLFLSECGCTSGCNSAEIVRMGLNQMPQPVFLFFCSVFKP